MFSMKRFMFFLAAIAALTLSSCGNDNGGVKGVKHVVVIGFDGFAGNLLADVDMPTLHSMMDEGSWTAEARSILPSSSACNWASMYMGVGPEMHGYNTWGSSKPDFPSIALGKNGIFPTMFTVMREKDPNMDMCAMYEWDVQEELIDKAAVTYYKYIPAGESHSNDITSAFTNYLKSNKPGLALIAYDSPDHEGHQSGWGSSEYMTRMHELDSHLKRIVDATKEAGFYDETIFVIVADHGGINTGHGGTLMAEMNAPLIFFGHGVKKNNNITVPVMRYDTAPTIVHILGGTAPDVWRGRIIKEAFE